MDTSAKNIVLYADDDIDDIQLVRDAFSEYSQNVKLVTVEDGLEALSFLKNLSSDDPAPCLIILDINMPRMDGKEALVKIRQMKRFEDIPSILFTTSSQKRDKDFAEKYNAGFLTKPIDFTQMDIIARKFIEHCSDDIKKNITREFN
ncbi:response regulator [Segetibacter aerophilus]|uniref:Two-component system response regulator n=1 Tax=Segetibacter aerophilus TaxID=670293 RepID=A0A512BEK7_9BACT|nr:response regulator [Segetibacter aerophilus]GEO10400.1 two-component system response regulator [Segetibacter aerophilus]